MYHDASWDVTLPLQQGWCPDLNSNTPVSRRVNATSWHQLEYKGGGHEHDTCIFKIKDHIVILSAVKCTWSIRKLVCHSHQGEPLANWLHFWMLPLLKSAVKTNISIAFSWETSTVSAFLTNKYVLLVCKYFRRNYWRHFKELNTNTRSIIAVAAQLRQTFPKLGKTGNSSRNVNNKIHGCVSGYRFQIKTT